MHRLVLCWGVIGPGLRVFEFGREDATGLSGSSTWGGSLRGWGWVVRLPGGQAGNSRTPKQQELPLTVDQSHQEHRPVDPGSAQSLIGVLCRRRCAERGRRAESCATRRSSLSASRVWRFPPRTRRSCWRECSIGPGHYSSGGAARWAVYWAQSRAERAAHRAAVPGDRPRMSARTAEGIAALWASEGRMPRWTSCPRTFSATRCLPGRSRRRP